MGVSKESNAGASQVSLHILKAVVSDRQTFLQWCRCFFRDTDCLAYLFCFRLAVAGVRCVVFMHFFR